MTPTPHLVRVRWQETWGDQLQGVLDDPYLDIEIPGLIAGLAVDWFPNSDTTITQDPDSATTWTITSTSGQTVHLFVEPIGGPHGS